jgi:hypothetical protein
VLKEAEAGVAVQELSRRIGFSDATFYHWKARKYMENRQKVTSTPARFRQVSLFQGVWS